MTGASTYFGNLCRNCRGTERYTSGGNCVACARGRSKRAAILRSAHARARQGETLGEAIIALEQRDHVSRSRIVELERENQQLRAIIGLPEQSIPFFGLTVVEHAVFGALMARQMVSEDSIRTLLYSTRAGDEPESNTISVFVCRLRGKLKPYGVGITNRFSEGWFITPADKSRIREILKEPTNDCATATSDTARKPSPAPRPNGADREDRRSA
jgi:hypothetical protein